MDINRELQFSRAQLFDALASASTPALQQQRFVQQCRAGHCDDTSPPAAYSYRRTGAISQQRGLLTGEDYASHCGSRAFYCGGGEQIQRPTVSRLGAWRNNRLCRHKVFFGNRPSRRLRLLHSRKSRRLSRSRLSVRARPCRPLHQLLGRSSSHFCGTGFHVRWQEHHIPHSDENEWLLLANGPILQSGKQPFSHFSLTALFLLALLTEPHFWWV